MDLALDSCCFNIFTSPSFFHSIALSSKIRQNKWRNSLRNSFRWLKTKFRQKDIRSKWSCKYIEFISCKFVVGNLECLRSSFLRKYIPRKIENVLFYVHFSIHVKESYKSNSYLIKRPRYNLIKLLDALLKCYFQIICSCVFHIQYCHQVYKFWTANSAY